MRGIAALCALWRKRGQNMIIDPEARLTRTAVAAALTAKGFPVRAATLATKATRGGGPPYQLFGARPLYRWADALEWAQSRLSPPRRSTSEADASPGKGARRKSLRAE
jgi:hypothetical protein